MKLISIEMGRVGVLATQLWHQTFIDGSLADLPSLAGGRAAVPHFGAARRRGSVTTDAPASYR